MSYYINNFFAEKTVEHTDWSLTNSKGQQHYIDSDVVIEHIKTSSVEMQIIFSKKLRELDFHNAPIEPFLEYVAKGMIEL